MVKLFVLMNKFYIVFFMSTKLLNLTLGIFNIPGFNNKIVSLLSCAVGMDVTTVKSPQYRGTIGTKTY